MSRYFVAAYGDGAFNSSICADLNSVIRWLGIEFEGDGHPPAASRWITDIIDDDEWETAYFRSGSKPVRRNWKGEQCGFDVMLIVDEA